MPAATVALRATNPNDVSTRSSFSSSTQFSVFSSISQSTSFLQEMDQHILAIKQASTMDALATAVEEAIRCAVKYQEYKTFQILDQQLQQAKSKFMLDQNQWDILCALVANVLIQEVQKDNHLSALKILRNISDATLKKRLQQDNDFYCRCYWNLAEEGQCNKLKSYFRQLPEPKNSEYRAYLISRALDSSNIRVLHQLILKGILNSEEVLPKYLSQVAEGKISYDGDLVATCRSNLKAAEFKPRRSLVSTRSASFESFEVTPLGETDDDLRTQQSGSSNSSPLIHELEDGSRSSSPIKIDNSPVGSPESVICHPSPLHAKANSGLSKTYVRALNFAEDDNTMQRGKMASALIFAFSPPTEGEKADPAKALHACILAIAFNNNDVQNGLNTQKEQFHVNLVRFLKSLVMLHEVRDSLSKRSYPKKWSAEKQAVEKAKDMEAVQATEEELKTFIQKCVAKAGFTSPFMKSMFDPKAPIWQALFALDMSSSYEGLYKLAMSLLAEKSAVAVDVPDEAFLESRDVADYTSRSDCISRKEDQKEEQASSDSSASQPSPSAVMSGGEMYIAHNEAPAFSQETIDQFTNVPANLFARIGLFKIFKERVLGELKVFPCNEDESEDEVRWRYQKVWPFSKQRQEFEQEEQPRETLGAPIPVVI